MSMNVQQIQKALQSLGRGSLVLPQHPVAPAQSMRRAVGMGDYDKTANWSWMYNPPPFNFLNKKGVTPPAEFYAPAKSMGLGCGCGCGGGCAKGMGLFDSPNPTSWGLAEWAIVTGGAFVAMQVIGIGKKRRRTRQTIERAKWGTE